MSDLIRREDAVVALCETLRNEITPIAADNGELLITAAFMLKCKAAIRGIPASAGEATRHGHWIVQDNTYTRFKCSFCLTNNQPTRWPFCSHCGAKMEDWDE